MQNNAESNSFYSSHIGLTGGALLSYAKLCYAGSPGGQGDMPGPDPPTHTHGATVDSSQTGLDGPLGCRLQVVGDGIPRTGSGTGAALSTPGD